MLLGLDLGGFEMSSGLSVLRPVRVNCAMFITAVSTKLEIGIFLIDVLVVIADSLSWSSSNETEAWSHKGSHFATTSKSIFLLVSMNCSADNGFSSVTWAEGLHDGWIGALLSRVASSSTTEAFLSVFLVLAADDKSPVMVQNLASEVKPLHLNSDGLPHAAQFNFGKLNWLPFSSTLAFVGKLSFNFESVRSDGSRIGIGIHAGSLGRFLFSFGFFFVLFGLGLRGCFSILEVIK